MFEAFLYSKNILLLYSLLAILFCLIGIFIYFQKKSKKEQEKYFQQLSNSFEEAALICNAEVKLLFSNNSFKNTYGLKVINIAEFLNISNIEQMPLGAEFKINSDDGKKLKIITYKMMNRTKYYQEELFIIIIKNDILD